MKASKSYLPPAKSVETAPWLFCDQVAGKVQWIPGADAADDLRSWTWLWWYEKQEERGGGGERKRVITVSMIPV